jgi:peptidoglycan hydrolase-like protein with peptidoglycan-binding domain
MNTWRNALALAATSALITAGVAFAQGEGQPTSPSGTEATEQGGAQQGDQDAGKGTGKGQRAARGGGQEHVRAAQQALKQKGQDPGPIDGVLGPRTQAALKAFQQAEGLTPTGRPDPETMAKLGVSEAGTTSPSASPSSSPSTSPSQAPGGGEAPAGQTKDAPGTEQKGQQQ